MPKRLEVRAVTSFGAFRQGRVYDIDIEDDRMMSLLGVGYLEPTSDLEEDYDWSGVRGTSGGADLRDVRVVGSSGSEAVGERKVDVEDHPESSGDPELSAPKRGRGRGVTIPANPSRGEDSGTARKP